MIFLNSYFFADYLKPVADQIESVAKLSIKSQVLYMTGLNVSPQWSESYMHYALPQDQLPLTINAIEAKLGMWLLLYSVCLKL